MADKFCKLIDAKSSQQLLNNSKQISLQTLSQNNLKKDALTWQRYGQLNQINKFICSYNYITQKLGFIIENIVNQRVSGSVSVIRSIRGLKCKSQILPVNCQFYESVITKEGENMLKLREEIELDIPEGQSYTVLLKLKGGIDTQFFKTFDFGC